MRTFQLGHYVGTYLRFDGRQYLCVAYDPSIDYFVSTVDDGPPRFTDISTRAIGRTYHENYDREAFSRPQLLVDAVAQAYAAVHGERPEPTDLGGVGGDEYIILARLYCSAKAQFSAWKAERDEYYRKRREESAARERAEQMRQEADEPMGWQSDPWPRGYR